MLHFLRHTVHRCTTPWGSAERGAERNGARGVKRSGRGAARPSASDECDFEKGERAEYGRPPSSFGTSAPLSTTHSPSPRPSPSPSPHYHLLSSINFHHVNLPTSPSFLYPGSYVSPKSTHNYKTFNLNVKLKRNGFSSVSTVAVKSPRSVSPMIRT